MRKINNDDRLFLLDALGRPLTVARFARTPDLPDSGKPIFIPPPPLAKFIRFLRFLRIGDPSILAPSGEDFTNCLILAPPCQHVIIVASCKDLILCHCVSAKPKRTYYIVCNPFTMQYRIVAPCPIKPAYLFVQSYGLWCDFMKMERRYRVVRLLTVWNDCDSFFAEIFSSETESWNCVKIVSSPRRSGIARSVFNNPDLVFNNPGIAGNGLLCWLETSRQEAIVLDPYSMEPGRFIPIPQQANNTNTDLRLGVCQGYIRLLQVPKPIPGHLQCMKDMINVWELRDYKSGQWNKVHETALEEIHRWTSILPPLNGKECSSYNILPLNIHPSDRNTVFLVLTDYDEDYNNKRPAIRAVSCNLQRKEVKIVKYSRSRFSFPVPGQKYKGSTFPVELPLWPTPI